MAKKEKQTHFILNDESVLNSHGFFILNAGGDFERFNANPVMLDAHGDGSCLNVIGRWGAPTVEGSQLLAEPEFDLEDENAAKIAGKVDRGYVKGASMGLYILDAEMRDIPGQGFYPVVTRWELLEASPVPVPSNKASLRLYAADRKTVITLEQVKLSIDTIIKLKNPEMEKITLTVESARVLGLGKSTDETELNAAIMELSAKLTDAEKAKATAERLKTEAETKLSNHAAKQATDLVELAVKEGRITADKKDSFIKLATSDYDQAKTILEALPGKANLSDKVKTGAPGSAPDRADWDYMKWAKEDSAGLQKLAAEDPTRFTELKAAYKSKS